MGTGATAIRLGALLFPWMLITATAIADPSAESAKGDAPASAVDAPTGNGEVIERVVAVVNGEALFLSDLRRRALPFLPRVMEGGTDIERYAAMNQLYKELLSHLVDERLIEQTARELEISVVRDDVDRAVSNVKVQSGLDEEAFWDAVLTQGFTMARYRADVRRQLVRLKVMNQKVRSRVNLTEEDVRRRYEKMTRQARRTASFRVTQIFVPVAEESATEVVRARAAAVGIRNTLTNKNFEAKAAEHGGGDLGWVSQGDLSETLENALLDLEEGDVSPPVRGPRGFHIFLLRERTQQSEGLAGYADIRSKLYKEMIDAAMAKQEAQFLRELRKSGLVTRRL